MTTTQIIVVVAAVAIIALVAASRMGGPRVTVIETKSTEEDGDDA